MINALMLFVLAALALKAFYFVAWRGSIRGPVRFGVVDIVRSLLEFAAAGVIAGRLWGKWQ